MAGNIFDDSEIIKQQNARSFIQYGGPGTPRYFFGIDTQYHFIDGANLPANGSIDPIYVPDPRRPGRYRLVSRTVGTPDLPTVSLMFHEKWGGIPRMLMAPKCTFNLYEVHSNCGDLSDFYRGWESYMLIYAGFRLSGSIDLGARTARDSDDPLGNSVDATGAAIYPVGALSFGEEATTEVVVEVIDVVYGQRVTCGNCGAENDGSQHIYALTRANVGSPAAPGQLVYSTDGGVTWTTAAITGIGSSAEPRALDIAGNILFVITDGTTLFTTTLNADTGAPGTWSTVTLPVAMNDVYVQSPSAIWFAANSGRVYKTTDITTAPQLIDSGATDNLLRISGDGVQTIVAVGANGRVYRTINGGTSWASLSVPAATSLSVVQVLGRNEILVGGADGKLYRTRDGSAWQTILDTGGGTLRDLLCVTREVFWLSWDASSTAHLSTSLDGGASWAGDQATSRILNWPTFQRGGRLAAPITADPAVAANYLAIAGLAAGGADGILIAAAPTLL